MSEVMSLFPTPLMRVPGAVAPDLIQPFIEGVRASAQLQNAKSSLLSHTEMVVPNSKGPFFKVSKLINPHIVQFGTLLLGESLVWSIKEMWVNVLETGGRQAAHNHANSFVSGIVYLTESHAGSRTVFMKSPGGTDFVFRNDHAGVAAGAYSADKWISPPCRPGDLALFPSYLLHAVPPNEGERRVSLAFNAIPTRLDSWGYAITFGG